MLSFFLRGDVSETVKEKYYSVRKYINCCEPIEMALVPIVSNLVAVALGPKNCMAVPCFVTKEQIKRRGPPYHTDVVVQKMEDEYSSFVRVNSNKLNGKVLAVVEIKMIVSAEIRNVPLKDILELLIYLVYIMDDHNLINVCGMLTDVKTWQCINVGLEDGKLRILDYVYYHTDHEENLVGFLPAVLQHFKLIE